MICKGCEYFWERRFENGVIGQKRQPDMIERKCLINVDSAWDVGRLLSCNMREKSGKVTWGADIMGD